MGNYDDGGDDDANSDVCGDNSDVGGGNSDVGGGSGDACSSDGSGDQW